MREIYTRWRDEGFLPAVARILATRGAEGREELQDLHDKLGSLLGVGKRGGDQVRERWGPRCPDANADECPHGICNWLPKPIGHYGPYLQMRVGRRWVNVEESPRDRAERRVRALARHFDVPEEHVPALLAQRSPPARRGDAGPSEVPAGAASNEREGWLEGEEAEEARKEIRRRIIS